MDKRMNIMLLGFVALGLVACSAPSEVTVQSSEVMESMTEQNTVEERHYIESLEEIDESTMQYLISKATEYLVEEMDTPGRISTSNGLGAGSAGMTSCAEITNLRVKEVYFCKQKEDITKENLEYCHPEQNNLSFVYSFSGHFETPGVPEGTYDCVILIVMTNLEKDGDTILYEDIDDEGVAYTSYELLLKSFPIDWEFKYLFDVEQYNMN